MPFESTETTSPASGWIAITEADLLTVMAGPELEGIRAAALKAGQADPVAPTIAQVVDQVRGYVAAYRPNALQSGDTIPAKLLAPALDLLAVRIPQRVGKSPSEGRRQASQNAIRLLEQVSAGKYVIDLADDPTTDEVGGSARIQITSYRDRVAKGSDLDGL